MQPTPRRDPKKFAQRTMAAAIAAAVLATGNSASAQTTGGGIGAAVNAHPNAAAGVIRGTTPTGGGTTAGVAAPNALSSPVRVGAGPGINNTGSPVVTAPRILQTPLGGSTGATTPGGTSRIPGNTIPNVPMASPQVKVPVSGPGLRGAAATNPSALNRPAAAPALQSPARSAAVANRAAASMRTGTISNFTDNSISFREGANTSTLTITPDTVVQMGGQNIPLRDIPANSQVRVERSSTNPNAVQRIVVMPPSDAAGTATVGGTTAGSGTAATSPPRTGGSIGTARKFNTDINAGTSNASVQPGGLNAPTANGSVQSGGLNAPTTNASVPGGDINSPVVNNPNVSNRAFAPGRNPADQPVAPFTRGKEVPLQAGFSEFGNQNTAQGTPTTTDGSQFLGPVRGEGASKPGTTASSAATNNALNATSAADPLVTHPNNPPAGTGGTTVGSSNGVNGTTGQVGQKWNANQMRALDKGLGMTTTSSNNGLTVGNVTNNSIAAKSGLTPGDRIQSINGQTISSAQDLAQALQGASNPQAINAQIMRNGNSQNVNMSLPNGFFNGLSTAAASGITGAGAGTTGFSPGAVIGASGQVSPAVNTPVGPVVAPTTSEVNTAATQQSTLDATVAANERSIAQNTGALAGNAGGTAAAGTAAADNATETEPSTDRTANQQQPQRVFRPEVPVGTQKNPVVTEALKVPSFNLGGELRATPEGVVVSSLVNDGLAAKSKIESGDIIETINGRPITAPGAVPYEMHRHRAGSIVDIGLLRDGKRITRQMKLPESFEPQLLNRSETFGTANKDAKEQGASGARPIPVKPTEESRRTLEQENQALKAEIEQLRSQNRKP